MTTNPPITQNAPLQPPRAQHALAGQWIHAFTGGLQVDSSGHVKNWTEGELDELIETLDPTHPPRHTIEHGDLYSAFAFGDITAAKRDGLKLYVQSEQVSEQLDALVDKGHIRERSLAMYQGSDGKWRIDHLAWLGAKPPAVEGLEPVKHSEGRELVTYSYKEERKLGALSRLFRGVRDFVIDQFDRETADRVVPEFELENLDDMKLDEALDTRLPPPPPPPPAPDDGNDHIFSRAPEGTTVSDPQNPAAPKTQGSQADDARIAQFEAQRAADAKRIARLEHQAAEREAQAVVTQAVQEGRLTPAESQGVAAFMATLPDSTEEGATVVSFSRAGADGKPEQASLAPRQFMAEFMARLPKRVSTEPDGPDGGDAVDATDHQAVADKARAYQHEMAEKGIKVSVAQAFNHVTQEG